MRETASLKSLASNTLTRVHGKKPWHKHETGREKSVLRPVCDETTNSVLKGTLLAQYSSLSEDFEERLAIAEYDGHQSPAQAQRIAYQDAFIAVLTSFPDEASSAEISPQKWLGHRIQSAQAQLKNMERIFPGGKA